mmetsp:Transcript_32100/g.77935  ORF Transcript_32100/g.77935 Transcript_32100/m.77935 type:complete len:262 (-) Transcript_32100:956-1741(-)
MREGSTTAGENRWANSCGSAPAKFAGIPMEDMPGIPMDAIPGIPMNGTPGTPMDVIPGIPMDDIPGIPMVGIPGIPMNGICTPATGVPLVDWNPPPTPGSPAPGKLTPGSPPAGGKPPNAWPARPAAACAPAASGRPPAAAPIGRPCHGMPGPMSAGIHGSATGIIGAAAAACMPATSCVFASAAAAGVASAGAMVARQVGQVCCRSSHERRQWKWNMCPQASFLAELRCSRQIMHVRSKRSKSSSLASGKRSCILCVTRR